MPAILLTFAPMIDSEAARLLLAWYHVPHVERDRLFGSVSLLTLAHRGHGVIPLVYGDGKPLSGPRAIADCYDVRVPARRLMPSDADTAKTVEAGWTQHNMVLGTDVATFAYFHLLPEREAMIASFGAPVTATGRATLPFVYPLLAALFRAGLGLTPVNAAAARERIDAALDAVDAQIADGRAFLGGEHLTLADIGLASACAPLMLPPSYARFLPPWEAMPIVLRDAMAAAQQRPCAALVARIYSAVGAPVHRAAS